MRRYQGLNPDSWRPEESGEPMPDQTFWQDFAEFTEEIRSLGLDPREPTAAKPGSEEKVAMLAARYAAGLPLWHNDDCYTHDAITMTKDSFEDEVHSNIVGREDDEDGDIDLY